MRIKTTLPITEARKNIFFLADEVQKKKNYYTLTEHGRPKAVLVSAEKFETLTTGRSGGSVLADGPSAGAGFSRNTRIFSRVLIVRDASKIVYLDEDYRDLKHKEEELIKSQLYIKLIEECRYPLVAVEIGRYVKIGAQEGKRYIEADIIINDRQGNVKMIFETITFDEFEESSDRVIFDLFELARATTWVKKPEKLICYSRAFRNGAIKEKIVVIDYGKFNTFAAWKKAGRPHGKEIPKQQ